MNSKQKYIVFIYIILFVSACYDFTLYPRDGGANKEDRSAAGEQGGLDGQVYWNDGSVGNGGTGGIEKKSGGDGGQAGKGEDNVGAGEMAKEESGASAASGAGGVGAIDGGGYNTGTSQPATCTSLHCSPNSHCVTTGEAHCECDPGYESNTTNGCTNIDDCRDNPCGSLHTCEDGLNDYSCVCSSGYLQVNDKRCVAPFVDVAAGQYHTCGRRADGTAACWGFNTSGQLGDNGPKSQSATAVTVLNLTNIKQLAAGSGHTCARISVNAGIACWGWNEQGQLGTGGASDTDTFVPVVLSNIDNVVDIGAGYAHTCAVRATGSVACWGWNDHGQLGNGTTADSPTPVEVTGLSDATQVSGGTYNSCARRLAGGVACWGHPSVNGTSNYSSTPLQISNLSNALQVSVGDGHACARRNDGSVVCWGISTEGQLGNGAPLGVTDQTSIFLTPGTVGGLIDTIDISAGLTHTCAVRSDGRVLCWGNNEFGQLGNGSAADSNVPVLVTGLNDATDVTAGAYHSCARRTDGNIACWGRNDMGQLGDGNYADSLTPVTVVN